MVAGIGFVGLSHGYRYYSDRSDVKHFNHIRSYNGLKIYRDIVEEDFSNDEINILAYYHQPQDNTPVFVAGLTLTQYKKTGAFQVSSVYNKKRYRGLGIPVLMYETAILYMNTSIVSGNTQSYNSPSIWRQLYKRGKVNVGAFNENDMRNILDVHVDVDRLDCYDMPMYETDKEKYGYENRLFIAYKG